MRRDGGETLARAEFALDPARGVLDTAGIAQIHLAGDGAMPLRHFPGEVGVQIENRHLPTLVPKPLDGRLADAAGAAGNRRDRRLRRFGHDQIAS